MELREKELSVFVEAQPVQHWATLHGEAPKTSIGLGEGGNGKRELAWRDDDVSFEPLEETQ